MIVMKFGGTSVGSAERIKVVYDIVSKRKDQKPVVVSSAVGGVTDKLIDAAKKALQGEIILDEIKERHYKIIEDLGLKKEIIDEQLNDLKELFHVISETKEYTKKIYDTLVSFGERMSTRILAEFFTKEGMAAKQYDAFDIGFVTDANHGDAEILDETYNNIKINLTDFSVVPVITGFIAKSKSGEITTLGRGGSDYTAAIIGAAIGSDEIQIWTDVNGVMTTDPRIVSNAKTIPKLSFDEASELAFFGAKVLHPKTIVPAVKNSIPVKVLNTHEPEHAGSVILNECEKCASTIKAIACKKNVTLVNVSSTRMLKAHGFLAKVFEIFSNHKVSIDMVSTSEVSISMTLDSDEKLALIEEDLKEFADIKIEREKALICMVGEGMKHKPGIAGKMFSTIGDSGINLHMISQGASEINISFIIDEEKREDAVKALHKEFLE